MGSFELAGKHCVVTGAGSGIGRALAGRLAGKGATVAVCDIDPAGGEETVRSLPAPPSGPPHSAWAFDVADRAAFDEAAGKMIAEYGHVDVLVNNAGVLGQMTPLLQLPDAEFDWVLGIDLQGVVNGVKAFLPHLAGRPEAAIANLSSLAGLAATVGNGAYFTAKFGVRGFTEYLRSDLRRTAVSVTCVHPGLVKTNLGASSTAYSAADREAAVRKYNANPGVSADYAAGRIVRGIERRSPRVLIGADVWFIDKLVRIAPGHYDRLLDPVARWGANRQRPDGKTVF